jgi:hypothetical protein
VTLDQFLECNRMRVGEGPRAIHSDDKKAISTLAKPFAERVSEVGVN